MNNEYVIINKSVLEKRIEELESKIIPYPNFDKEIEYNLLFIAKKNELNQVLSQSTPLIPEIEKAHNAGRTYGVYIQGGSYDHNDNTDSEDYVSNLKLGI